MVLSVKCSSSRQHMISEIFSNVENREKVSSSRMYLFIFSISVSIVTFFPLKKAWIASRNAIPLLSSGGFLSVLETNYKDKNYKRTKNIYFLFN